jgi:hypothetical protein
VAFTHPLAKNFTVRCGDGFLEQARNLVGSLELWDEIQENFDINLARDPYAGDHVVANVYGLNVLGPSGTVTVFYLVIEEEQVVELLEAVIV